VPPIYPSVHQQRVRTSELFDTFRSQLRRLHFPDRNLIEGTEDPYIEIWSRGNTNLIRSLRSILPFASHLQRANLDWFVDHTLDRISQASLEQLSYWQLANRIDDQSEPLEHILIELNEDHFWLQYVPENAQAIRGLLYEGEHVFFITRFFLSHDIIEVGFDEIRISTRSPGGGQRFPLDANPPRFVITDGRNYSFRWNTGIWTNSLANPDDAIINPTSARFPPLVPQSTAFAFRAITPPIVAPSNTPLPRIVITPGSELVEPSLPPSSPSTTIDWDESPEPWNPHLRHCWCNKEVCDCGYRPDTPPTPTDIQLWRPGQNVLPSVFSRQP
jgi:hypothetical protein